MISYETLHTSSLSLVGLIFCRSPLKSYFQHFSLSSIHVQLPNFCHIACMVCGVKEGRCDQFDIKLKPLTDGLTGDLWELQCKNCVLVRASFAIRNYCGSSQVHTASVFIVLKVSIRQTERDLNRASGRQKPKSKGEINR